MEGLDLWVITLDDVLTLGKGGLEDEKRQTRKDAAAHQGLMEGAHVQRIEATDFGEEAAEAKGIPLDASKAVKAEARPEKMIMAAYAGAPEGLVEGFIVLAGGIPCQVDGPELGDFLFLTGGRSRGLGEVPGQTVGRFIGLVP